MEKATNNTLLEVKDLAVSFFTDNGEVPAVRGISFDVDEGESLGIVGESGCGKSVTVSAIMRLLPSPPGKIMKGEIWFRGHDLLKLSENAMCDVRGDEIAMIFQEPMTALNPVQTIGHQIAESLRLHMHMNSKEASSRAVELLKLVEIPSPEMRANSYPHQLSGGMRQRVMIAMALACKPKLLIADEPTTALDVTIQAQILDLLRRMRQEFGMTLLMITHDLGVIAEMCDRVIVMYAGVAVEYGEIKELYAHPYHPYTQGLFDSIPRMNEDVETLHVIEGMVSDPLDPPSGCYFHPRCPYCTEHCVKDAPKLRNLGDGRLVACHYPIGKEM